MTDSPPPAATVTRAPRRASMLWLIPVAALAVLAAFLFVQVNQERGPVITITFPDAAGLEPGADLIHRGLSIGVVRGITLSPDFESVVVEAELAPFAEGFATEGTRFWIVRPEVGLGGVSGLDTIIGPRYIAVEEGRSSDAARQREFIGLASAPDDPVTAEDGLLVRLRARSAGSITRGSAVLYRNTRVGRIIGVKLADDATAVEVEAVIDPTYARLVRDDSRFWDASGVGVDFGLFRGLSVEAGSIDAVLRGAVAFATPTDHGPVVEPGHEFDLEPAPESKWLEWSPAIQLDRSAD
ncbi:MAG: MlaD family protein [Planctomycetota bacterium]